MIRKKINFIITGSSQNNQAVELYRMLKKDYDVNIILTNNAKYFLKEIHEFNDDINDDIFGNKEHYEKGEEINSVAFQQNVKLNVVYPASANFLAKINAGIADDLASLVFSITNATVKTLIFPAFYASIERSPFVMKNINSIKETNYLVDVFPTEYGFFEDGSEGYGVLLKPKKAFQEIENNVKF